MRIYRQSSSNRRIVQDEEDRTSDRSLALLDVAVEETTKHLRKLIDNVTKEDLYHVSLGEVTPFSFSTLRPDSSSSSSPSSNLKEAVLMLSKVVNALVENNKSLTKYIMDIDSKYESRLNSKDETIDMLEKKMANLVHEREEKELKFGADISHKQSVIEKLELENKNAKQDLLIASSHIEILKHQIDQKDTKIMDIPRIEERYLREARHIVRMNMIQVSEEKFQFKKQSKELESLAHWKQRCTVLEETVRDLHAELENVNRQSRTSLSYYQRKLGETSKSGTILPTNTQSTKMMTAPHAASLSQERDLTQTLTAHEMNDYQRPSHTQHDQPNHRGNAYSASKQQRPISAPSGGPARRGSVLEPYVLNHSNVEGLNSELRKSESQPRAKSAILAARTSPTRGPTLRPSTSSNQSHASSKLNASSSIVSAYEAELAMMEKELARQRGNNAKLEEKIKKLAVKLSSVRTRPLLSLVHESDVNGENGVMEFKLTAAAAEEERRRKWNEYTGTADLNWIENQDDIDSTHEDFGRKNNLEASQYQEQKLRSLEQEYRNKIMLRKLNEKDEKIQQIRETKRFSKK